MKYSSKLMTIVLTFFILAPLIWIVGLYYYEALESISEVGLILLHPPLIIFIAVNIGTVVIVLRRQIRRISAYMEHQHPDQLEPAQKSIAFIPKFFVAGVLVYSLVGPHSALLGQDFINRQEYWFSVLLALPIISIYSISFFAFLVVTLERWVSLVPVNTRYRSVSLKFKLTLNVLVTCLGIMILFMVVNINSVYNQHLTNQSTKVVHWNMVAAASVLIAVSLNMYALFASITVPVNVLRQKIHELAENGGDLTREISLNVRDDLGELGRSVNLLLANIRPIIRKVQTVSEAVEKASSSLARSAASTAGQSRQITESMKIVNSATLTQQSAVEETLTAVEQMSSGIFQIAESSGLVSDSSTEVYEEALAGQRTMNELAAQMDVIYQSMEQIQTAVTRQNEQINLINGIGALISDLAGQTNLLSLNASIEAARAGEVGRGFAVVAGEIRKLAEQSGQSVQKISQLVQEIQAQSDHVTLETRQGKVEVENGKQEMTVMEQRFHSITHSIESVRKQILEVTSTAEQMSAGAEEVTATVNQLSHYAQITSGHSQKVTEATTEQIHAMEDISTSTVQLSELSQELNDTILKFKA